VSFVKARAHVIFHGIVQGVFFRANTRKIAIREEVAGWVRNLPDGTVEAVMEGDKEDIERVLKACTREIPMARVDKADVKWQEAGEEFVSFEVRY
jgi:acylphosphatase